MSVAGRLVSPMGRLEINWDKEFEGLLPQECWKFSEHVATKFLKANKLDVDLMAMAKLVNAVTTFHLRSNNKNEPYGPMAEFYNRRTAIPSDLDRNDVYLLEEIASRTKNAEFGARLNDVLWIKKGDETFAAKAISEYVRSANVLFDEENWTDYFERIERSLVISDGMKHGKKFAQTALAKDMLGHLEAMNGNDPLYLSYRIILALAEWDLYPRPKLLAAAEKGARSQRNLSDPHRAEKYDELLQFLNR